MSNPTEADRLADHLRHFPDKAVALEAEVERLRADLVIADGVQHTMKVENERLRAENERAVARILDLHRERDDLTNQVAALGRACVGHIESIDYVLWSHDALIRRLLEREACLTEAQAELSLAVLAQEQMEARLAEARAEVERLRAENDLLGDQCSRANGDDQ